jgi:hypothetical protein
MPTKKTNNLKQDLERLKNRIKFREMSDDGYYVSRQYKEDCRRKFELEQELRKAQEKNR